jgi:hypothetical protein
MVSYYMDNRSNSRANTCVKVSTLAGRDVFIRLKTNAASAGIVLIHSNYSDRMASRRRQFIQISALSAFDGSVVDYRGIYG